LVSPVIKNLTTTCFQVEYKGELTPRRVCKNSCCFNDVLFLCQQNGEAYGQCQLLKSVFRVYQYLLLMTTPWRNLQKWAFGWDLTIMAAEGIQRDS